MNYARPRPCLKKQCAVPRHNHLVGKLMLISTVCQNAVRKILQPRHPRAHRTRQRGTMISLGQSPGEQCARLPDFFAIPACCTRRTAEMGSPRGGYLCPYWRQTSSNPCCSLDLSVKYGIHRLFNRNYKTLRLFGVYTYWKVKVFVPGYNLYFGGL